MPNDLKRLSCLIEHSRGHPMDDNTQRLTEWLELNKDNVSIVKSHGQAILLVGPFCKVRNNSELQSADNAPYLIQTFVKMPL